MSRRRTGFDAVESSFTPLTGFSGDPPKRGRRPSIATGSLLGDRDRLVWLLENSWGAIGYELQMATTIEQVRAAFAPLVSDASGYNVIDTFARTSVKAATGAQLRATRQELARAIQRLRETDKAENTCRESHEKCVAALRELQQKRREVTHQHARAELDAQVTAIEQECESRQATLISAQQEHEGARRQERGLSERLRDEEAFFAQTELLRFILSQRYSLTPVNFANAMAGLPRVGWRQSFKRCRNSKSQNANSTAYQQFKIVSAALSQATATSNSLITQIKYFLQRKVARTDDFATLELKTHWYCLQQAIERATGEERNGNALPYRILAEYQRRLRSRSALDLLLEEENELK